MPRHFYSRRNLIILDREVTVVIEAAIPTEDAITIQHGDPAINIQAGSSIAELDRIECPRASRRGLKLELKRANFCFQSCSLVLALQQLFESFISGLSLGGCELASGHQLSTEVCKFRFLADAFAKRKVRTFRFQNQ